MASRVRVTVRGERGVRDMLDDIESAKWKRAALIRCAKAVARNVETQQIKRGTFAGDPDPLRVTSRTGDLRDSLKIDRRLLPKLAIEYGVDPLHHYGWIHELGHGSTPARPFLLPGLEDQFPHFVPIFLEELDRATKEHRGQVGP